MGVNHNLPTENLPGDNKDTLTGIASSLSWEQVEMEQQRQLQYIMDEQVARLLVEEEEVRAENQYSLSLIGYDQNKQLQMYFF